MNEGTSRTGLFSNFIRRIFGAPTIWTPRAEARTSRQFLDENKPRNLPAVNLPEQWSQHPLDVAISPHGTPVFYDDFYDRYTLYVARQQDQVLVNPLAFDSQNLNTGEVKWWSERPDEEFTRERVEQAIKIYEHIAAAGVWHPNIVPFVSRHEVGYTLERCIPGPLRCKCEPASKSDVHLALYQRWALQLISALSHLHRHGVVLNAVADEGLWLRSDFSIAFANFLNAGCQELGVSAGDVVTHELISPWSPSRLYDVRDVGGIYPGSSKGDIFDWATVVYSWMSGNSDPVGPAEIKDTKDGLAKNEFNDWPELDAPQLGPIMKRAWKGQYSSAEEVLTDVKTALVASGREIDGDEDDIVGVDWKNELEIMATEDSGNYELRRKLNT